MSILYMANNFLVVLIIHICVNFPNDLISFGKATEGTRIFVASE